MLFAQCLSLALAYWPYVCSAAFLLYLVRNKYYHGFNKYPGPLLAHLTGWWRFFDVFRGLTQHTHVQLHKKYGDIVRLGPDVLSFADPAAVKDIYGLKKGFVKTEFYPVQNNISNGHRIPSLFSTTDDSFHTQFRRCVNAAFSMSTMVSYEPLVDSTTTAFLKRTKQYFCDSNSECDFARWLQFYAFDVIGEITFSRRLGFVDTNKDVDGITKDIADMLRYAGYIGQQPWLDRYLLHKNPLKMFLARHTSLLRNADSPVSAFAKQRIASRREQLSSLKHSADPAAAVEGGQAQSQGSGQHGVDFLTRFTIAQTEHPEFMTDARVLTACTSLINAGSDTTAATLSAVFYYLLKHRRAYDTLMQELDGASAAGTVAFSEAGTIAWADARKLPYLDAVINETFRLFPAVGLLLERHVPPQGASICGEWIPGGAIVGCNAWVLHRRPEIFGEDVEAFRPERWLEVDEEKRRAMEAGLFQFGAGTRTCIGRNISVMEVYKLVPAFVRRFEINLTNPDKDWRTLDCWFMRQLDFNVRFRPRAR